MAVLEFFKDYKIHSFECESNKRAKFTTLCNFMQDIAWLHAEKLGYGYWDFLKKDLIWVLSRLKVEINKYPEWNDDITLKTIARGVEGLFALRDFEIYSQNDKLLGTAYSSWLIINSKTLRPQRPDFLYGDYPDFDPYLFKEEVGKIGELKEAISTKIIDAYYSYIDVNQHVNNVCYLEWLLNFFPYEFHREHAVKEFSINYLHEVKPHDKVVVSKEDKGDSLFLFEGVNKSHKKKTFVAKVQF